MEAESVIFADRGNSKEVDDESSGKVMYGGSAVDIQLGLSVTFTVSKPLFAMNQFFGNLQSYFSLKSFSCHISDIVYRIFLYG